MEEAEQLSGEEQAMVHALREVEARTKGSIVDVASLERRAEGDPAGWTLTVGLCGTQGTDADTAIHYRVTAGADGSLEGLELIEHESSGANGPADPETSR